MSRIKNNPLDKASWINEGAEAKPEEKPEEVESIRKGLKGKLVRATFIVNEDLLEKLKDLAYTNRTTIKDEINAALENYLEGKEIMERPKD